MLAIPLKHYFCVNLQLDRSINSAPIAHLDFEMLPWETRTKKETKEEMKSEPWFESDLCQSHKFYVGGKH